MPADAGPDGVAAGGRADNATDRGCSAAPHRVLRRERQDLPRDRYLRRARRAEQALRGAPATEERFRSAAEAEFTDARPLPGNAFKVPLARNVIVRTLLELAEEAR